MPGNEDAVDQPVNTVASDLLRCSHSNRTGNEYLRKTVTINKIFTDQPPNDQGDAVELQSPERGRSSKDLACTRKRATMPLAQTTSRSTTIASNTVMFRLLMHDSTKTTFCESDKTMRNDSSCNPPSIESGYIHPTDQTPANQCPVPIAEATKPSKHNSTSIQILC